MWLSLQVITIILLNVINSSRGWKLGTNWARNARKAAATSIGVLSLISFQVAPLPAHGEETIANQLAAIQAGETLQNQGRLDTENGAALTRELQLKPYQLIARGIITLSKDGIDNSRYPIGYSDAVMIDQKYDGNKAASLIS